MHPTLAEPRLVALASAAGEHALGLYLASLAALCIAAAALSHVGRRVRNSWRSSDGVLARRTLLYLAFGFAALLAAGTATFFAIGARLSDDDPMVRADQALSTAIGRSVPAGAVRVLAALTHLGDPPVLTVVCLAFAALLWARRQSLLALALMIAAAGNAILNPALKEAFARARPAFDALPSPLAGYSFPSGHTSGAMVLYGMLAYIALRTLPARWHAAVLVLATAVIWTTACSRVLLRAHFASDVIAGFCSGGAWLAICITSVDLARRRRRGP